MKIDTYYDDKTTSWVVTLSGYIDLFNAPQFRAALKEVGKGNIVISCEDLGYIDSAGMNVLVDLQNERQKKGYSVLIRNIKSYIYRLFELTGLHETFIIENIEEMPS